jgi:hypothetical protein
VAEDERPGAGCVWGVGLSVAFTGRSEPVSI